MSRELISVLYVMSPGGERARMVATYHVTEDEFEARFCKSSRAWIIDWRWPAQTRMFRDENVLMGDPLTVMGVAMRLKRQAAQRAGKSYEEFWAEERGPVLNSRRYRPAHAS